MSVIPTAAQHHNLQGVLPAADTLSSSATREESIKKTRWMEKISDIHRNSTNTTTTTNDSNTNTNTTTTSSYRRSFVAVQTSAPALSSQPPYRPVSPFFSSNSLHRGNAETNAAGPASVSMSVASASASASASPWGRSGPGTGNSSMELSAWERRERSMDAVLGNTIRCLERTVSDLSSTSTPPPAPFIVRRRSGSGQGKTGLLYNSGRWPHRPTGLVEKDTVAGVEGDAVDDDGTGDRDGVETSPSLMRNASEGTHVPHTPKSASQRKKKPSSSRSRRRASGTDIDPSASLENKRDGGVPGVSVPVSSSRRTSRRGEARASKRRESAASNPNNTSPPSTALPSSTVPQVAAIVKMEREVDVLAPTLMDQWRYWFVQKVPAPVRLVVAILMIAIFHFLVTCLCCKVFRY